MTDLIALPEPAMKTHGPFSDEAKHWFTQEQMLDFANLIRQDEREACAQWLDSYDGPINSRRAEAIRARTTT